MSPSPSIAVADDEPDMRDWYARILPRLGYRVVAIAANGADLVRQCRDLRPDLIITDVTMPDMDGIEAAARLGEDGRVPVLLVSAHASPVSGNGKGHVVGHLVKPIRQADLAAAITRALGR